MTIDELKDIHGAVKLHPYREDKTRRAGYRKLLSNLLKETYDHIKNKYGKGSIQFTAISGMYHDFNCCIGTLNWADLKPDSNVHLERGIGVIHIFLNTGEFPYYYTHYTGCNIYKSLRRVRKHTLAAEGYSSDITKEECEGVVKEIEDYKKKKGKYGRFMHSEEHLNYYKALAKVKK